MAVTSIIIRVMPETPPDSPKQPDPAPPKAALKDRVKNAIQAIDLEHTGWEQALDFLCRVRDMIDSQDRPKPEHNGIIDMINPVLGMYGYHPADRPDKADKKSEK